jgi:sigma-B regulation protein RsbU (phosphoserine phosphatase)
MSEIVSAALKNSMLFRGIEDRHLDEILQISREVSFAAGEAIFETGDPPNGMFVILEGEAQVDVGGRFHRLRAGDFFGEMALLAPDKRMATVRAVEPVRALQIEADAFQSYLLEHPQVAVSMLGTVVLRLREVEQRIDAWIGPVHSAPGTPSSRQP